MIHSVAGARADEFFPVGVFLGVFLFWGLAVVLTIVAVVQVASTPEHQFRAAGTEKTTWLLITLLLGPIGALVWLLGKRSAVNAARGRIPAPAPGWYPEPSGGLRWWDGVQWGPVHRQ